MFRNSLEPWRVEMASKIDREKLRAELNMLEETLKTKIDIDKIVDDVLKLSPNELDEELRRSGINPDMIEAITSTKH